MKTELFNTAGDRQLSLQVVFVNRSYRHDRLCLVEEQLREHQICAVRSPGVNFGDINDSRGFQNTRRYACSVAKRIAIRNGFQSGAESVLLLEDDVVFHLELRERLEKIELPEDWGLFYLGCRHLKPPVPYGPSLLRCTQATDNHAVLIHRNYKNQVIRGLSGTGKG